ncbi:RNA polymerase subunit sigma [Jeotgalibacillus sp. S-D1]|uniref:sigma factor-like helix-turn-helix DNA-binding protein n=1 Tax=Jeotgalibacillus sp. S-D1 TaxID=2552189 RepID=UPI00105A46C0|nr:sigma factor-like helix-turn-helix DNA-binding protein [Jeotgalibacillus sp. S-D1]TDL30809.1 RNA polymerase subunit sigma [Jeotgalibacillus sp. S-D1]
MHPKIMVVKNSEEEKLDEILMKLQGYCSWLTKNKWDSEEIAQEALVKALKSYERKEWTAPLLKKIAYHIWIDRIRKAERETLMLVEHAHQQVFFEGDELFQKLAKKLTPKQLIPFVLKEGFQYRISEIAEVLGMTETGVKALLSRARARMKGQSESDIDVFWEEELMDELFPVLIDAVSRQDPEKLLAMLPAIFSPTARKPISSFPSYRALSLAA